MLLLAAGWGGGQEMAAAQPARELDIKAAMVFNFAQFARWPESAFPSTNAPFVIGIIGADPFGARMDELVKGETIHGRPMAVRRFSNIAEVTQSQILFVSASEASNWPKIRGELGKAPVLTVSDMEKFATRGGMIRLVMEQNRVRFRINARVAEECGLELSSKLLRLAEIIETTED